MFELVYICTVAKLLEKKEEITQYRTKEYKI